MIKITNLKKVYQMGDNVVKALNDVNLEIKQYEYASIMGSSGSGKSTLMNVLGCLDKPTSGEYYLDSINVKELSSNELAQIRNKKIGFIFQSFNLLPKLTAFQNVELPMIYAGMSKTERMERASSALEKVGLKERMNHRPNELSGGQRQRVAIARSLVNDPVILLADEPTGNLDSKSGKEIMEIFQKLNEDGSTIVMVTHEPEIAEFTKRIIVFKDGQIISDQQNKRVMGGFE